MNKAELIDAMVESSDLFASKAATERALMTMIECIKEGLKKDGTVQLIGFGTFAVKERAARTGRNPKTGETMPIPASKSVGFKVGKQLKDAVGAKPAGKAKAAAKPAAKKK